MLRVLKSELIRLNRPSFLTGGIGGMAAFGAISTLIGFAAAGKSGAGPGAYIPSEAALAAREFDAAAGLGGLPGSDAASLQDRAQHLTRVFRSIHYQDAGAGVRGGAREHRSTSLCNRAGSRPSEREHGRGSRPLGLGGRMLGAADRP